MISGGAMEIRMRKGHFRLAEPYGTSILASVPPQSPRSFIISGGAVSPETIPFSAPAKDA
ncbi:hypothetical protein ACVWZN_001246 [Lysobacter sp. HA35]